MPSFKLFAYAVNGWIHVTMGITRKTRSKLKFSYMLNSVWVLTKMLQNTDKYMLSLLILQVLVACMHDMLLWLLVFIVFAKRFRIHNNYTTQTHIQSDDTYIVKVPNKVIVFIKIYRKKLAISLFVVHSWWLIVLHLSNVWLNLIQKTTIRPWSKTFDCYFWKIMKISQQIGIRDSSEPFEVLKKYYTSKNAIHSRVLST